MSLEYSKTVIENLLVRSSVDNFITSPVKEMYVDELGIISPIYDKHRGLFMKAGVRDDGFHRRGDPRDWKFNHRQLTIIDNASLDFIADGLEIDEAVVERAYGISRRLFIARHIGANIVTGKTSDGQVLNDLIPPYHLGHFDDQNLFTTAMLVISYNQPCVNPGKAIGSAYIGQNENMGRRFVEVARAHRGFAGVVSLAGSFQTRQEVMIVPLSQVPSDISQSAEA